MRLCFLYIVENIIMQQLNAVSNKLHISQQELISIIQDIDPSNRYAPWILKQIKFNNIRVPEDNHRVKETLNKFNQYKNKLEIKDINKYKTIHDLETALEPLENTGGSKRSGSFQVNPNTLPGVESTPIKQYMLHKITDPESLSIMGLGTKWCTRKDYPECQSKNYLNRYGAIYIISKDNKPVIQFTPDLDQVMDINDESIRLPTDIEDIIINMLGINKYKYLFDIDAISITDIPKSEAIKDTKLAFNYAYHIIRGRWPEAEPIIMQDPKYAYYYAFHIVGGRWPEAEPTIMQNPRYVYEYANTIIRGRWPEAESIIMKHPKYAYEYAYFVIRGRWPEAEPTIIKNPEYAYRYAYDIIGGRWPEAEPTIIKNPEYAYRYAYDIIGGRWPEAEPTIVQNLEWAFKYARDIIKGRWPEAEPTIMKDPEFAYYYALNIIRGRWPEAEPTIMKRPGYSYLYAFNIIRGRWKKAELIIMQHPEYSKLYKEFIKNL